MRRRATSANAAAASATRAVAAETASGTGSPVLATPDPLASVALAEEFFAAIVEVTVCTLESTWLASPATL